MTLWSQLVSDKTETVLKLFLFAFDDVTRFKLPIFVLGLRTNNLKTALSEIFSFDRTPAISAFVQKFNIDRHSALALAPHSPSTKCLNSRFPSGQSPNPDSPLICPAAPMSTNRLPQARANSRARCIVRYGSVLLATTMVGNGSRSRGTGEKSLSGLGASLLSTSTGATSNAPLILWTSEGDALHQCASAIQPRLWAAKTIGGGDCFTSAVIRSSHQSL